MDDKKDIKKYHFPPYKFFNYEIEKISEDCKGLHTVGEQLNHLKKILSDIKKQFEEIIRKGFEENKQIEITSENPHPITIAIYTDHPLCKRIIADIESLEGLVKYEENKESKQQMITLNKIKWKGTEAQIIALLVNINELIYRITKQLTRFALCQFFNWRMF